MNKVFLLMILLFFPIISNAQPAILFDTENYNFGDIIKKDVIEYAFEFTNAGDEELIVNKIVPS